MSWSRKKPEPPPTGSDWYWYWDLEEKEPWVIEVYKGCHQLFSFDGYWWDEPVQRPSENPKFKKKDKEKKKQFSKPRKKIQKDIQEESMLSVTASMPSESNPNKYKGNGLLGPVVQRRNDEEV